MKKLPQILLYSAAVPMMMYFLYILLTASDSPNPEATSWMAVALLLFVFLVISAHEMVNRLLRLHKMRQMIDRRHEEVAYGRVEKDGNVQYYAFWTETSCRDRFVPKPKGGQELCLGRPTTSNEMRDGARIFRATGPYLGKFGKLYVSILGEEFILE